ncbi:MAG: hypothetical protein Q9217_001138 [Psora testacea]
MPTKRKHEVLGPDPSPAKRQAINGSGQQSLRTCFRQDLFDEDATNQQKRKYAASKPYRHGVINDLIDPTLLRSVRTEIQQNLSFAPKETDIYKIHQSGDLANLDGLEDTSLKLLPSLKRLRDALYSHVFREYLCEVTQSKFLSGKKTDMAINVYTPGCHLLCHDDVIGSRRISYILYLTDPDRSWKKEWGGALRLYPTEEIREGDGKRAHVPKATHSESVTPAFNQLSFFAVQPGQSFHDVEEVYAAEEDDEDLDEERVRIAISGWYHIPQEGEDGHISGEEAELAKQSSLAQLQGRGGIYDRPQPKIIPYALTEGSKRYVEPPLSDGTSLSEQDLDFLLKYIAPSYLTPDTQEDISSIFREECCLHLDTFLCCKFSDRLRRYLERADAKSEADEDSLSWDIARPPHKHRYLYQRSSSQELESPIQEILRGLFPSAAFHKWLQLATGQSITSHDTLARRFRRGQDYTLAQSYESEVPRIEICLSITPSMGWGADSAVITDDDDDEASKGARESSEKKEAKGEKQTDVGGYLAYMASDDADDADDGSHHCVELPLDMSTGGRATKAKRSKADPAIYKAQEDDEDDSVLFSMPAGWNKLGIVLRDWGTMRFVKYVSRQAKGDRWDIFGEFEIDPEEEDENEEEATTIHDDEIDDNKEDDDDEGDDGNDDENDK